MKKTRLCIRFYISGKVQGVWYRASTQKIAHELGLTGYAKNLTDGRVEIIACGTADQIEQLSAWLWQGPPGAEVSDIFQEELGEEWEFEGFDTF